MSPCLITDHVTLPSLTSFVPIDEGGKLCVADGCSSIDLPYTGKIVDSTLTSAIQMCPILHCIQVLVTYATSATMSAIIDYFVCYIILCSV